jgi:hypothetical protein
MFARSVLRPWGLEPTIRRRVRSIEPFASPSGSDPAGKRFREAPARRSPAPPVLRGRLAPLPPARGETCCPRPLSAAPRASRVLRPRSTTRVGPGWTSETPVSVFRVGRPLARSAGSSGVLPLIDSTRERELAAAIGLDALRTRGPYERFTLERTPPSPGTPASAWRRSVHAVRLAPGDASLSRPGSFRRPASLTNRFVSVVELGTAPRSTRRHPYG